MILRTEFETSCPREFKAYHGQHHLVLAGGDKSLLFMVQRAIARLLSCLNGSRFGLFDGPSLAPTIVCSNSCLANWFDSRHHSFRRSNVHLVTQTCRLATNTSVIPSCHSYSRAHWIHHVSLDRSLIRVCRMAAWPSRQ
jgi:hypothetical protein